MKKLILSVLCIYSLTSYAAYLDGKHLYKGLQDYKSLNSMVNASQAIGYIQGFVDSYKGSAICVPIGESTENLVDNVHLYLGSNEQFLHYNAEVLLNSALSYAYPCK